MAILADRESRIVIQGITGREASMVTKHSLAYGTRILAGISPGKGGQDVEGVPVYDTLRRACLEHNLNTSVVYVPPAFAYDAVMEAIDNGIKLIVVITERIPRHDVAKFLESARRAHCIVVGPNSVGIISPGARVKLGAIGGDNVERSFVPGGIGVVSRSGGMTAEISWMLKRAGLGVSTSVSIGGDPLIGSPTGTILSMFENDPETKGAVIFGEPGTAYEEEVADLVNRGGFTKPLVAYVAGRFVEDMPEGTVFGHAASIIEGGVGKPSDKMKRLQDVGVRVAARLDDIAESLVEARGRK